MSTHSYSQHGFAPVAAAKPGVVSSPTSGTHSQAKATEDNGVTVLANGRPTDSVTGVASRQSGGCGTGAPFLGASGAFQARVAA